MIRSWSSRMRTLTTVTILASLALCMAAPLAAAPMIAVPMTADGTFAMQAATAHDVEGGGRRKLWLCAVGIATAIPAVVFLLHSNPIVATIAVMNAIESCT
jgi:hypothetical protein